jgi:hypothetical protein
LFNQLSWRIAGNAGSNNDVRFYFMQDAQPDFVFKAVGYKGGKTGSRKIWVTRPKAQGHISRAVATIQRPAQVAGRDLARTYRSRSQP